jgi:branched-chain amino acid transport system substrate-binding protein
MKTRFLYVFLAAGILISSLFTGPMAYAQQKGPIKIGLVTDLTGFLNVNGVHIRQAALMALEEGNNTVAGRPIEFIIEDEAGNPAQAMDKARKLVETDKVCAFLGPFHGGAVVALANYANKVQIPQIITWYSIPGDQMLTMNWSWVPIGSLEQIGVPSGAYAYDKMGFRTATTLGLDYIAGRKFMGGCTDTFEKKGGKVIQQQWMPMDTKDTAPYLTALKQADVFMPWYAGVTHNVGIRQIREYGVKMPIILPQAGYMAHPDQIKEIGDYGVGFITSEAYVWTIDTPENKAFVDKYKKKWNMLPAGPCYGGYFNMQILLAALRKTNGDTSPKVLAKALDETKMKGFLGDFAFGDARLGIGNYFVQKEIKKAGDPEPYQSEILAKYQVKPVKAGNKIEYEILKAEMLK